MYKEIGDLLELSKRGDRKAKEELLTKLHPLIISSIKRYYNKVDIYDDLIQEGYEVILKGIKDYDPNKGVYFLGYIKLNLKYHYLNKYKEKQLLSLNEPIGDGELEIMDLIEDEGLTPIDKILDKEIHRLLNQSLNTLTQRQREIVVEYYINNLSIGQIADKLGLSYRTVVNTKTTGINKLKNTMVK